MNKPYLKPGPPKVYTKHINLKMTVEMHRRIKEEARDHGVGMNHAVRHMINLYFMRRGMSDLTEDSDEC